MANISRGTLPRSIHADAVEVIHRLMKPCRQRVIAIIPRTSRCLSSRQQRSSIQGHNAPAKRINSSSVSRTFAALRAANLSPAMPL